jgi:signal transduction histidine kinase
MGAANSAKRLLQARRPVLRVQLALLYSGVFIGLVVVLFAASSVLFGTSNVFFGHSQSVYRVGAAPAHPSSGPTFSPWPLLIALGLVGIGVFAAWWLAGRFLRPLRTMTAAARQISATNLNRRLSLAGPEDELTELGQTLDDLFARLQASFDSQRQFVANASHELRTPLAGQRTLLQVALADPGADARALRDACEEALQLSGQQEQLIDALLALATSERGVERWESFDLARLTRDAVHNRRQDGERRGIEIDTHLDPAVVSGDASLAESLITNLLENAIRHNLTAGSVQISTATTPDGPFLRIANTGPEVPAADLDRLFQPFQRLGPARVGPAGGHGLGLAIVQAIADAHGASLTAHARPHGGLDVVVTFRGA